jgi:hypothetical protein
MPRTTPATARSVNQRVKEEFAFLASKKGDKAATDAWATQAVFACRQF